MVITHDRMPPTDTDEGVRPRNDNVAIAASLVLSKRAVDVVLMDVNLPGISGIEATKQIVAAAPTHA